MCYQMERKKINTKFPHEVIEGSIQDKKDEPVFVRDSMVEGLGIDEEDILEISERELVTMSRQPLQEINYGQDVDEKEPLEKVVAEKIKELKEKYGDDWESHIDLNS